MSKRLIIGTLILFTLFGAFASTVYVSGIIGDDSSGDGTESNPYKTLTSAVSNISSSGEIVLLSDITQTEQTVISGKTITIDGTGYSVFGPAFKLSNSANLALKNIKIDGKNAVFGTDGFILISSSSLTLSSGADLGNAKASNIGQNSNCNIFRVEKNSSVTMNEGSCIHNLETPFGAIRFENSTFTMNGGTIRDCGNTPNYTGDWSNAKESVTLHFSSSSCYIKGGTITSNSGEVREAKGIIYLHLNNNTLEITGGSLSGNTVKNGSGLYLGSSGNIFKISGNPVIANNVDSFTEGKVSNLYLPEGQYIALSDPLTEGANIGLYSDSKPTASADVMVVSNATLNDAKYIHSDNCPESGIVFCDGTKDWDSYGNEITDAHHTHSAGTIWLSVSTKHVHKWNYGVTEDSNLFAYCSNGSAFDCKYFGSSNAISLRLDVPVNEKLIPEISPVNATNKNLLWSSSDTSVLTVDQKGFIRGVEAGGPVTVTATTTDGSNKTATCIVSVTE